MRFEKIEVSTTRPNSARFGGKVTIECEAPQYESYDEFVAAAGSPDKALEYINGSVATSAGNGGRAFLRGAPETAEADSITSRTREITRGYTPTGGARGPSKKTAVLSLLERLRSGELPSEAELDLIAAKFGA